MADDNDLKLHELLLKLIETITVQKEKGAKIATDEYFTNKRSYELFKDQLKLKKSLNFFDKDSLDNFIETGKRIKENNKRIAIYSKELERIVALGDKANAAEKDLAKILAEKIKGYKAANDEINKSITGTVKWGSGLKLAAKAISSIGDGIKNGYGMIKNSGLFEMDKAIKNSALSMGILSKQSDEFASQLTSAANDTIEYGVGIADLAKAQASYSDAMGRTVILGKEAAKQLGAMAAATGLGAEGAGEFAGEMDRIGFSAQRTSEYVEQIMNDAHAMGLNASKVVKTIGANIKLLNKYNFKGGAQGLAKMAQETQRMGVDMSMVAPLAEKVFNVEGAVAMSAQLQVLGGEWSKLADPFKLMYMARNDMEGLTKAVIQATIGTARFNKETGEFDISSLEMQRLRQVAEATGMDFEQLAQSAKKAAQFAGIKKQISYGFDKKTEEFIESTAFLDKTGRASIDIDGKGTAKFVNELNDSDKKMLMQRAAEKESMAERAKGARTFDDALNNTFTLFKQLLLPIITTLNTKLMPKVDKFVDEFKKSDWPNKLEKFAKTIGDIASWIGSFIVENPKLSAGLLIGSKVLGFLMDKVAWYTNGIALGRGFLATTEGMGGGVGMGGGKGGFFGSKMGKGLVGGLGGAAIGGVNAMGASSTAEGTGNVIGGILGGAAGTLLDEFMGPFGTMLGAEAGSLIGGKIGSLFANDAVLSKSQKVNDGIVNFNPKDKFTKVDDSTMIAGTNANGNNNLANQLARRPSTLNPVSQDQMPRAININFGQLTMGGSIELKLGTNYSKELGKELILNQSFIRDITKLIHMETEKNLNSGKPKG